jgi:O-antigen/teichoic acid export membrane protein
MSLLRKALLVNATAWVGFVISMGQAIVLSRGLGPGGVGQYNILHAALLLTIQLASLGLPNAYLVFSKQAPQREARFLMASLWLSLATSVVGGGVLAWSMLHYAGYFGTYPLWVLGLVLIQVPISMVGGVIRMSLMVKIEARRLSLMTLVTQNAQFLLLAVPYLLGYLTLAQAIIAAAISTSLRLPLGWVWSRHKLDVRAVPEWSTVRSMLSFGVRRSWADVMTLLNAQLSIILIKYLLDDFDQVGYFSRGQQVALLAVTAGQAALPMLLSRWSGLTAAEVPAHAQRVLRFLIVGSLVLFVGLMLTGRWIVLTLHGAAFAPAVVPFYLLAPGTAMILVCRAMMELLVSRNHPELPAVILGVTHTLNAGLCFLLVPMYGIAGAAVASTATTFMMFGILLFVCRRVCGLSIRASLVPRWDDWRIVRRALTKSRSAAN